jgi:hypothetical protein
MTITAPVHSTGPRGQKGILKRDASLTSPPSSATDLGEVYENCERVNSGAHSGIDTAALPGTGPATFTVDLLGSKVPFTLRITTRDDSGGYPGPETQTDYDMGPSNTSQSINLASGDIALVNAEALRRY